MSRAVGDLRGRRPAFTGARRTAAASILVLSLAMIGCGGIRWQGPTFPDAHALARRQNKLTFVYFRSWYLVECTHFEEKVLKHPEVLAATRDMVCVALDYDWDQPLAQQWRLKTAPAFAVVGPGGELLARQHAPITREELLRGIQTAQAKAASSTQPAATGPP
jgi:hypothetical protein